MPSALLPLCAYLRSCFGRCTGLSFLDSTSLKVCHNRRIWQHKVFENLATRGKTSVDWFFGFKLHLVVNDKGELLNFTLTPGNIDDRQPVPKLLQQLFGKVFADKGYVSQKLAKRLLETVGVQLITKLRRNMKNRLVPLSDQLLLRKRAIIETVIAQLKNISPLIAFSSPQSSQLSGQPSMRFNCLLPSTQEALHCHRPQFAPCCLTQTHVNLFFKNRLRIIVGWVELSETQQMPENVGFVPQPNLHNFIFSA